MDTNTAKEHRQFGFAIIASGQCGNVMQDDADDTFAEVLKRRCWVSAHFLLRIDLSCKVFCTIIGYSSLFFPLLEVSPSMTFFSNTDNNRFVTCSLLPFRPFYVPRSCHWSRKTHNLQGEDWWEQLHFFVSDLAKASVSEASMRKDEVSDAPLDLRSTTYDHFIF